MGSARHVNAGIRDGEDTLMRKHIGTLALSAAAVTLLMAQALPAVDKDASPQPGTITVPQFTLPYSEYGSPEARADFALRRAEDAAAAQAMAQLPPEKRRPTPSEEMPWIQRALAAQRKAYPAVMTEGTIGGVGVRTFIPAVGVARENSRRVLINLHAGGFTENWDFGSQIESLPFATVGRIKVISVNYRMAPQHRFPAASEDVASVYRELLKSHKPSEIAIYGCSAGGVLAPQAIAWFQKERLPMPAALGVFSGSLARRISGDSLYMAGPLAGYAPPKVDPDAIFQAASGGHFAGVTPDDPLVWPGASKAVLAKFPPTILSTGVRAVEMSATVQSHLDLTNAGVDARLYLWEGVGHCFIYNPELPESRQLYGIASKFFLEAMRRK